MNPADTLFLALLGCYIAYALATNPRRGPEQKDQATTLGVAIQAPLFLLACWHGLGQGLFSRDWISPPAILLGLAAGHATFAASLLATHRDWRAAWEHLLGVRAFAGFLRDHPDTLMRTFAVAVSEEIIYRGAAQPLLHALTGSAAAAIVLVAAAFSVVHWHFFRNPPAQSAEFAAFSLLLGALYYATGSIMLAVVVHTVRNGAIAYLEHRIALEEQSGDAAARDLPGQAAPPPRHA